MTVAARKPAVDLDQFFDPPPAPAEEPAADLDQFFDPPAAPSPPSDAAKHTTALLERQRQGEGLKDITTAVATRGVHNLTAGNSDEGAGLVGALRSVLHGNAARMASTAPIDPNAQFDEFGNQVGAAGADAAGGYVQGRDADRAEQKAQAEAHPFATGLTDLGTAVLPGAGARLAVEGLGDSEATTAVGLGRDTLKGAGVALATELGGKAATKLVDKVGSVFAAKAAAKAAPKVEKVAEKGKAAMTPETLRNVRAEQEIQGAVRVNGRKLGEVGVTRVNGAPIGQVPNVTGGAVPAAAKPVGLGLKPAVTPPPAEKGSGLAAGVRDLAVAGAADYALAKVAQKLDLPYAGPLITAAVAAKKGSNRANALSTAADLAKKAHAAGLDAAAARLFAKTLPQALATSFLERWTEHKKETP